MPSVCYLCVYTSSVHYYNLCNIMCVFIILVLFVGFVASISLIVWLQFLCVCLAASYVDYVTLLMKVCIYAHLYLPYT